jgi:hypothetical protein
LEDIDTDADADATDVLDEDELLPRDDEIIHVPKVCKFPMLLGHK